MGEKISFETLIDLSQRCTFERNLETFNRSGVAKSQTCQDVTILKLLVAEGKVVACGFKHVGCVVSRGAAELVCEKMFNETLETARANLGQLVRDSKQFREEKPHRDSCVLNIVSLALGNLG